MEEKDPEEDYEVSEGKFMGSEDLKGDSSKSKMEAIEKENPEGVQEEERMEFIV